MITLLWALKQLVPDTFTQTPEQDFWQMLVPFEVKPNSGLILPSKVIEDIARELKGKSVGVEMEVIAVEWESCVAVVEAAVNTNTYHGA